MPKVLLPLAQGFEEIELVSIADVLKRGGVEATLASLHTSLEVRGAHHIIVKADELLENLNSSNFDAIALHGGMEGVQNMLNSSTLLQMLQNFFTQKKIIGAICAAPIVLDKLKLLSEDFCCYPGCEQMMQNTSSKRLDLPFKNAGQIITATGPAFAISFGLEMLRVLAGEEKFLQIKNQLLLS